MPKKLTNCVDALIAKGKSSSSAWAICQSSTGQKPHKKKGGK